MKRLSIPKPCQASWEDMAGGGGERFCESCRKTVHDLSSLSRRQAAELVNRAGGHLCARIGYDTRGRMVFAKEGNASGWERLVQISMLGVSALGAQGTAPAQATADHARACHVAVKVTDATGTVMPGAQVRVGLSEGSDATKGVTDDSGVFRVNVPEGRHHLWVEAPGFETYNRSDLNVRCGWRSTVEVPVRLEVGMVRQGMVVVVDYSAKARLRRWLFGATAPLRKVFGRG